MEKKSVEWVLEKYAKREVSLGRAAEFARLPLADIMSIAAERRIPINYSAESLERDFKAALNTN